MSPSRGWRNAVTAGCSGEGLALASASSGPAIGSCALSVPFGTTNRVPTGACISSVHETGAFVATGACRIRVCDKFGERLLLTSCTCEGEAVLRSAARGDALVGVSIRGGPPAGLLVRKGIGLPPTLRGYDAATSGASGVPAAPLACKGLATVHVYPASSMGEKRGPLPLKGDARGLPGAKVTGPGAGGAGGMAITGGDRGATGRAWRGEPRPRHPPWKPGLGERTATGLGERDNACTCA